MSAALAGRGAEAVPLGRAEWSDLAAAMGGCDAAYVVAPNFHPDEPAYVDRRAGGLPRGRRGSGRLPLGRQSRTSPRWPHHLGKAESEHLVRRSGLDWTILQPGVYLQNFDLTAPVEVPYDVHARFGFLDLADLGQAAATVLLEDGHVGATYELASRSASVAELATEAGTTAERVEAGDAPQGLLHAMFAYYDRFGLPAGTLPLRALARRPL